ncbi:DNA breaking-rejoining enzyme [Peniophora sp. CONT]|nr:DNA breaking-rejoining enzyme [Peniophora sp. CONT]
MAKITLQTRGNYAAGLLRYAQFCNTLGVEEEDRFPVTQERMAMFITYQTGKGADAGHFVDGLRMWMLINGVEWTRGPLVNAALGAHQNFVPADARRPPRPPVTPEHLEALRERLDFEDPMHCAVFAAACVAFWGVCRLGEVIPSGGVFDAERHVARSAVKFEQLDQAANGMKTLTFHIPFDKVKKRAGADIVLMNVKGKTSPIRALQWHLQVASPGLPGGVPLFAYVDKQAREGWSGLTRTRFLMTCDRVWREAGLPAIPYGHSFRIGGTTEYLIKEMDPDRVMMLGRWSSKAFLRYWRRVEKIVPLWSTAHAEVERMTELFAKAIVAFKKKHSITNEE